MTNVEVGELIKRIEKLDQKMDRIERKLGEQRDKKHWVKVSVVTELTGWDYRFLEKARLNGLITQREGTNGIEYLLESIPAVFIKTRNDPIQ